MSWVARVKYSPCLLYTSGPFETFKVAARRSNTDYELTSMDLNRQVGEALCLAYPEKKVQMLSLIHILRAFGIRECQFI